MEIDFGKYAGREIEDLPSGYLEYLVKDCEDEEIVMEAEQQLTYRDDHSCHFEED